MQTPETSKKQSLWQKTNVTNLVRYAPSGQLFARVRIGGKLKVRSLKTDKITVAQLRLADYVKGERTIAENQEAVVNGKMVFNDALDIYRERLKGDAALKERSKDYREERIKALLKSWPDLKDLDVRRISKAECLKWAARYRKDASPSNFNNTVGTLRLVLDIAVEAGLRYENPAMHIKRMKVMQKPLELPSNAQFLAILAAITQTKVRFSADCADLVSFLAYGGFRKGEAARITWGNCDFEKNKILVKGDPETGTKNWAFRHVPMIPEMRELLVKLRNKCDEEPLSACVMKIKECQGALTSACKKVDVKRITHHDLRHLFATRCIESGVDIPTVSRWLGHKDGGALAMKTYGHLREQHSVEMAQKVSFKPLERSPNVAPNDSKQP